MFSLKQPFWIIWTYSIGFGKVGRVELQLAVFILWVEVRSRLESARPVHQKQVNVANVKLIQGFLQTLGNIFRMMEVVPEFGGDKDFFSRHTAVADCFAYFLFIRI